MFGVQFYPTPYGLVEKMMGKVDWSKVHFALEPSAGKGDIAEGMRRRLKGKRSQIECVEIDPDLRSVLEGNGFCVVGTDFLAWDGVTRYDLIAMNPPFKDGDKHLAKALELMKHGGQIVCLLNASTVERNGENFRGELLDKLDEYGADVEFISGAFSDAERKTDVHVAIVYVNIPKAKEKEVSFDELAEAVEVPGESGEVTDMVEADFFRALVRYYQMEARLGLKVIDEFENLERYIPDREEHCQHYSMISLSIGTKEYELMNDGTLSRQNAYLRELRYKYWHKLFASPKMQKLFTVEVREKYMAQLERFRAYDFTMSNILQIQKELSAGLNQNIEEAILKMFDKLTYQHSLQKNNNVHYYNGWKSNDCCKVKQKVIVPFYGLYDERWGGSWSAYKAYDYLEELEKILSYLDNGRTDGMSVRDVLHEAFSTANKKYDCERLQCKYFAVELKKKGTVHIFFTNDELLKKFNLFGGRKKNWLPPVYGKKRYADMSRDEKAVVDQFEGKQQYQDTVQNEAFYFGAPGMLALMSAG